VDKKCKLFSWGGCQPNGNNFATLKDCQRLCRVDSTTRHTKKHTKTRSVIKTTKKSNNKNICRLNVDAGPCFGSFTRYYYNSKSGRCEKFIYGGCNGNKNNFLTRADCENVCHHSENSGSEASDNFRYYSHHGSGPYYSADYRSSDYDRTDSDRTDSDHSGSDHSDSDRYHGSYRSDRSGPSDYSDDYSDHSDRSDYDHSSHGHSHYSKHNIY
jgi:hypothetical protein